MLESPFSIFSLNLFYCFCRASLMYVLILKCMKTPKQAHITNIYKIILWSFLLSCIYTRTVYFYNNSVCTCFMCISINFSLKGKSFYFLYRWHPLINLVNGEKHFTKGNDRSSTGVNYKEEKASAGK